MENWTEWQVSIANEGFNIKNWRQIQVTHKNICDNHNGIQSLYNFSKHLQNVLSCQETIVLQRINEDFPQTYAIKCKEKDLTIKNSKTKEDF